MSKWFDGFKRVNMKKTLIMMLIILMSGCSGMELGGKLGIYAVDEKQDSSRTYRRPALKCLFISCNEPQAEGS